jgi:hypothetical protein
MVFSFKIFNVRIFAFEYYLIFFKFTFHIIGTMIGGSSIWRNKVWSKDPPSEYSRRPLILTIDRLHIMSWSDLPHELHIHILTFLCKNVISEYSSRYANPRWAGYRDNDILKHYPDVLSHFASTIQTCRAFHHAIANEIKFDGQTTASILLHLQKDKVKEALPCEDPDDFDWGDDGFRRNEYCRRELDLLIYLIGPFWNNQLILEDLSFQDVLSEFMFHETECFPRIYKLFENWGRSRMESPQSNRILFNTLRLDSDSNSEDSDSEDLVSKNSVSKDSDDPPSILGFVIGTHNGYNSGWQICSIAAVLDTRHAKTTDLEALPILCLGHRYTSIFDSFLRDLVLAPPNTWWLLMDYPGANDIEHFASYYIWDSKYSRRVYSTLSHRRFESLVIESPMSLFGEGYKGKERRYGYTGM